MIEESTRRAGLRKATLLVVSSLTVMAGATIAPALPEIARAFNGVPGGELKVRLLLTIPALAIALMGPVAGFAADRFGKRRLLLGALLLFGAAGTSGLYLPSLDSLLVGRVILGCAVAGMMTAATALIADYYVGEERSSVLGLQGATAAGGGIFFLTGGGLLADVHWRAPFLIYALSFLILPLALRTITEPPRHRKGMEDQGAIAPPVASWRSVALVYAIAFGGMLAFYMIPVQLPFHLRENFGVGNTASGLAIATSTLFGAISALCYGRFRRHASPPVLVAFTFFCMGMSFSILYFAKSYPVVLCAMFFNGWGLGQLMPNLSNWLVDRVLPSIRGRAIGGMTTALFLGQFVSPIVTTPLLKPLGTAGTFGFVAILLHLTAISFLSLVMWRRRFRRA